MTPLAYRWAGTNDVEAIVSLVESAYRGSASRAGWTTEDDILDGQRTDAAVIASLIANDTQRILLAESADELVACCELFGRDDGRTYFGMFAVRPVRQGAHIGRNVLTYAESLARELHGSRALMMTVINVRTELLAWYRRRGYVETGEILPFPYGDTSFGIPRRDDLAFVVLEKALT